MLFYDKIKTFVAIDYKEPMLWIITIYEPTLKEWKKGFKKRRQK